MCVCVCVCVCEREIEIERAVSETILMILSFALMITHVSCSTLLLTWE
jgi:hypothetical protein